MTDFTQIKPQTTIATSAPFYSDQYDCFTVSADNLAGAETVSLYMIAGTTNVPVALPDGVTQAKLTATSPALPLEGGPRYVFVKSVTAAPCGVYVDPKTL